MTPIEVLFWLLVGHAVSDFPLQGTYLATAKNRHKKQQYKSAAVANDVWIWCLSWHALIHAGSVALVTGYVAYGLVEFLLHWLIDFGRCEEYYDFGVDQALHVGCKVAIVLAVSF